MTEQAQVVIVGAGPTGLALGCALRRAGIDVVVLDRSAAEAHTSRAAVVHARTLEVLEDLGVSSRLMSEGVVVPTFTVRDRTRVLARLDFSKLPTSYPLTLMIPQSRTEAVLSERLVELGGAVQRPWRVTGVEQVSDGVEVEAIAPDGSIRRIAAEFVVGADGVHSAVREAAGIAFTGGKYAESFLLADVRMTWPLSSAEVQLFFNPAGLVVVAPLPGGHHRIVATMDSAPEQPQVQDVQALLDDRGPGGSTVEEVTWGSRFRVQHRVADHYRHGRIFLAGDAAHVHSPAGGQGMNTGIQDAIELGNILAAVLKGRQTLTRLDDYESSRRPVGLKVVALTDRATRVATVRGRGTRVARNLAIGVAARVPAISRRLTYQIAELAPAKSRTIV